MSKTKKNPTTSRSPESKSQTVPDAPVASPVRALDLGGLSTQYLSYFDVALPTKPGAQEGSSVVQVRRLSAAEDAEVNQIVRRVLPSISMAGPNGIDGKDVTAADKERLTRDLETAQAHARTLALLKAVPIITGAAAHQSFGKDLSAATEWLQGLLPEDVLSTLYSAVVGESPSVATARAVRFF
jgi:hypothetical protein